MVEFRQGSGRFGGSSFEHLLRDAEEKQDIAHDKQLSWRRRTIYNKFCEQLGKCLKFGIQPIVPILPHVLRFNTSNSVDEQISPKSDSMGESIAVVTSVSFLGMFAQD